MSLWTVPRMWNGDCWIIGGGISMLHQFGVPSEVIARVEKGELPFSSYSSFLSPLHSKNVIGTNIAFTLGGWVDVFYFCDARFFLDHWELIIKFPNLKVTCVGHLSNQLQPMTTEIKRLKRDYQPGLSAEPGTIRWNFNTGAAAINFAVLAGAQRILLLGFDMNGGQKTHWHNVYKEPTHRFDFQRFLKFYPAIAREAKRMKVEILNVSPNSALDVFPRVSLKEVL